MSNVKDLSISVSVICASPLRPQAAVTAVPRCLLMWCVSAGFVRARQAEVAGSPQIPDTRWQDVGGLAQVKREVVDLIQLPLSRPDLFAGTAARSGQYRPDLT